MNVPIQPNSSLAILPFHTIRNDVLSEDFIGFVTIRRHRCASKRAGWAETFRKASPHSGMRRHAGHRSLAFFTRLLIL